MASTNNSVESNPGRVVEASMLYYRIPANHKIMVRGKLRTYPNPSARLYRFGFRVDGSVWVLNSDHLPHNLLDDFAEQQRRNPRFLWGIVPYSGKANATLIDMCRAQIAREIEEAQERNAESLANMQATHLEALASAKSARERELADNQFRYQETALGKRAKKLLDDLTEAAKVFGLDPANLPIINARQQLQGLMALAKTRAHLYAQATQAVAETPMANAAQSSEVNPGILADYIEENGGDATALRDAFGQRVANDTPVTTPVLSTVPANVAAEMREEDDSDLTAQEIHARANGHSNTPTTPSNGQTTAQTTQPPVNAQTPRINVFQPVLITTEKVTYNATAKMLRCKLCEVLPGATTMPRLIDLRNHRKSDATPKRFAFTRENWVNGEMTYCEYRSEDGFILRVFDAE